MSNISLKLNEQQIQRLKKTFAADVKPNASEYKDTFIQNEDVTISIYKSGKVVFQGKDALFYGSSFIETKKTRQAGSDEVGTGDYFGPVIVTAAIIEECDYPYLEAHGVTDSKQMDDKTILQIGEELMKRCKHSLLILEPAQYNKVHETNNLNEIKARMHNQAYLNLLKKGCTIPKAAYVDQFCPKDAYFGYLMKEKDIYRDLIFETKAEEKYPAVAVGSVISRYAFLKYMEKLEKTYGLSFHKGAGEDTDKDALAFVRKYGRASLEKVAKLHFKNTEKLDELLRQK